MLCAVAVNSRSSFGRSASIAERPVIALPSTTQDGKVSRIVPFIREGAGVVTTRGHVHYVVTEFGVASLIGLSGEERVRAMIALAHPDHRETLTDEARKLRLI